MVVSDKHWSTVLYWCCEQKRRRC